MTLWDVAAGTYAVVAGYDKTLDESVRQRLMDLGFLSGATVECVRHVPFSGPRVFQVDGSIFALEQPLAQAVLVQNLKETL